MYVFRNGTISSSENIITAHRVSPRAPVGYKFARYITLTFIFPIVGLPGAFFSA